MFFLKTLARVLGNRKNARQRPAYRRQLRLEPLEDRLVMSTFTVININDSGPGSLRAAITNANSTPGLDTIKFNIPGTGVHTVQPRTALPAITDPVILNAETQPGYAGKPLIHLDGSLAGTGVDGLDISAGQSTVEGFVINRFSKAALWLSGNGGNVVQGNYIGADVTGTQYVTNGPGGNGTEGIVITSSNNLIGGTTPAARNLISCIGTGPDAGIIIGRTSRDATQTIGTGNKVQGNFIGTDVTGTQALGNNFGVLVFSNGNVIGGTEPGARNVISGNGTGVEIDGAMNKVQGNIIGLNATGTGTLGGFLYDQWRGVVLQGTGAKNNLIGGSAPDARNIISAHHYGGVEIWEATSRPILGFYFGNQVQGNFIGTDITGKFAYGNGEGVGIENSNYQLIGGTTPGTGNVIAGSAFAGIYIEGATWASTLGCTYNQVQGNWVGTDPTGTLHLGNTTGMILESGSNAQQTEPFYGNVIGSSSAYLSGSWTVTPGAGNTIAFNTGDAIHFSGIKMASNPVRGNAIYGNGGGITFDTIGFSGSPYPAASPVLQGAVSGATTTVVVFLQGSPYTTYVLDFYASSATDAPGQGRRYLGSFTVTTNQYGLVLGNFIVAPVGPTVSGEVITATATDYWGDTSTFSNGVSAK